MKPKTRKRVVRKKQWFVPVNRYTLIINLLITSLFWCPLTYWQTITHPIRTTYLVGKIALGAKRICSDTQKTATRIIKHITPKIVKSINKKYAKITERYGLADAHRLADETSGDIIDLHAPQDPLIIKGIRGIWNITTGLGTKLISII